MAQKHLNLRRTNRLLWMWANRLVGRKREADLLYIKLLEGWLSRGCTTILYETVLKADGPGEIAEVGSWKGKSTVALAFAIRDRGGKDRIYAIDHHQGSIENQPAIEEEGSTWPAFLETIEEAGVSDFVHPLKMDSAAGAAWLVENKVPLKFIFLDGSHEEEDVVEDIKKYVPLLQPGGLMAFHDMRPDGKRPGPYRAYKKTLADHVEEVGRGGSVLVVRVPDPHCLI